MNIKQIIAGIGIALIMQNSGALQYCLSGAELEIDKPVIGAFTPNAECDQAGEFFFENFEGLSSPMMDIQVVRGIDSETAYPIQVDIYAEGRSGGTDSKLIASLSKNGQTQIKLIPSARIVVMVWDKVCSDESNQQIIYTLKVSKNQSSEKEKSS